MRLDFLNTDIFQKFRRQFETPARGDFDSAPSGSDSSVSVFSGFVELAHTLFLFILFVFSMSFIALVFVAMTGRSAKAQTAALANDPATLATSALGKDTSRSFVFSGQVLIETLRTANEASRESYEGWYAFTGAATHKKSAVTGTLRLSTTQQYTYRNDDGTDTVFDNPILALSKSFIAGRDFEADWIDSFSVSTSSSFGANNEARRRTFLWSNGLGVTGSKTLGRFFVQQILGYTRSFYGNDIRGDGNVNSPDSLRSTTALYYSWTDRLSMGASLTYGYALSFQGVGRGSQLSALSIDYSLAEKIALSMGVSSERGTLEPDGQSDRIRIYAPEAAQYFFDLIFIL